MLEAASCGMLHTLAELFSRDLSPLMFSKNGSSALCQAISGSQHIEPTQNSPTLDGPSKDIRQYMLREKVRQIRTINYLLEIKAKDQLMLQDRSLKEYPLQTAARIGFGEALQRMLKESPDVNVCMDGYRTPLYLAAEGCHLDAVRILLKHKARVSRATFERGPFGQTPFHAALECGDRTNVYDIVKDLLEAYGGKSCLDFKGNWGMTPLLLAAKNGDLRCYQILIEYGASIHVADVNGRNLLHLIAVNGWSEDLNQIIEKFSLEELNARYQNQAPKKIAKEHGHKEFARLLEYRARQLKRSDNSSSGFLMFFRNMLGKIEKTT